MTTIAKYRSRLPQLDGGAFLTDGGLETTLIFHEGWELPCFAAFPLLDNGKGRTALLSYYDSYAPMAVGAGSGFILESPSWRASPDWGAKLGYRLDALGRNNRDAIALMHELRARHETERSPMVVSGCIGPRGDGYHADTAMSADEAEAYHGWQIAIFRQEAADMISAITMTNIAEALGLARAAKAEEMPCVISYTVETDGRLPSGESLREAIEAIDTDTASWPAYYMINCAHPTHFDTTLKEGESWVARIRGIRANASRLSHAELDNAPDLDAGDPLELGEHYAALRRRFPQLNVLGGCCGTDHRHISSISAACVNVPNRDVPR